MYKLATSPAAQVMIQILETGTNVKKLFCKTGKMF